LEKAFGERGGLIKGGFITGQKSLIKREGLIYITKVWLI
jgi:hypothetical protein